MKKYLSRPIRDDGFNKLLFATDILSLPGQFNPADVVDNTFDKMCRQVQSYYRYYV
jgi:hypothetical protein